MLGFSPGWADAESMYATAVVWLWILDPQYGVVNALFAAETMTGRDGNTVHALPRQPVIEALAG